MELEKSEGQKTSEISRGKRVGSTLVFCDHLGEQRQEQKTGHPKTWALKNSSIELQMDDHILFGEMPVSVFGIQLNTHTEYSIA